MSVSTKTSGRNAGMPVQPPGPISAPRVVNNRRVRAGGIALAVMLLALGAALSGIALVSASRTSSYLALSHNMSQGAQVTSKDLEVVDLSGASPLQAMLGSQSSAVIGTYAKHDMTAGSLVMPGDFTRQPNLIGHGDQQFPIPVAFNHLPGKLAPGDKVTLIPLGGTSVAQTFLATVVAVVPTGTDGSVVLYLAAPESQIPQIIQINAANGFGIATAKGD
jgi:hypothetical protein